MKILKIFFIEHAFLSQRTVKAFFYFEYKSICLDKHILLNKIYTKNMQKGIGSRKAIVKK